jgi:hypothetical protein
MKFMPFRVGGWVAVQVRTLLGTIPSPAFSSHAFINFKTPAYLGDRAANRARETLVHATLCKPQRFTDSSRSPNNSAPAALDASMMNPTTCLLLKLATSAAIAQCKRVTSVFRSIDTTSPCMHARRLVRDSQKWKMRLIGIEDDPWLRKLGVD